MKVVFTEMRIALRILFVVFFSLLVCSVTEVTSHHVMYFPPMAMGRTYDFSQSNVGVEIFSKAALQQTYDVDMSSTTIVSRVVKTSKDIQDVLDVSGQLSLKLGMGLLNIKGSGSYYKSTSSNEKTVEIMVKVTYKTISRTLLSKAQPYPDWATRPNVVGRHYIRAITYGGQLIASLKFKTGNVAEKEEIEASLEAGARLGGLLEAKVEGRYKQLIESVSSRSDLKISMYSTADMKEKVVDLDSFIKAIKDFPVQMKKTAKGLGVPIIVHLAPLSQLRGAKPNLKFKAERSLIAAMSKMVEYYNDITYTTNAFDTFLKKQKCSLSTEKEKKLSDLHKKLLRVNRKLVAEMTSLNLNKLSAADTARKIVKVASIYFGTAQPKSLTLPWKYMREFKAIVEVEEIVPQLISNIKGLISLGQKVAKDQFDALVGRSGKFERCWKYTFDDSTARIPKRFEYMSKPVYSFVKAREEDNFGYFDMIEYKGDRDQLLKPRFGTYMVSPDGVVDFPVLGVYIIAMQFGTKLNKDTPKIRNSMVRYEGTYLSYVEDKQQCPATTKTVNNVFIASAVRTDGIRPMMYKGGATGKDTFFSGILVWPKLYSWQKDIKS